MVALTRELEANHLLGVGALAGVAQRAVPLGQRRRQPGDVGVAALELVTEFAEASGEVGGRGLGGGRPGPLGVKRSFALTQLLLASCLLKLEHANAAGLKHRGDRLGGGRLDGAGRRGRAGLGWQRDEHRPELQPRSDVRGPRDGRRDAKAHAPRAGHHSGQPRWLRHRREAMPLPGGLDDEPRLPRRGRPPAPAATDANAHSVAGLVEPLHRLDSEGGNDAGVGHGATVRPRADGRRGRVCS